MENKTELVTYEPACIETGTVWTELEKAFPIELIKAFYSGEYDQMSIAEFREKFGVTNG